MFLNAKIKEEILSVSESKAVSDLKQKYEQILNHIKKGQGCYIWGTGKLGEYCLKQFVKNSIIFNGFIDNNPNNWDDTKQIYPPEKLKEEDIVIVASIYYPKIIRQLQEKGNDLCVYYEEFAYIMDGCETYYSAFDGIFYELEKNKHEYINLYSILSDDISKKVYENLLKFRMTLDHIYTTRALEISLEHGIQDFDELIVKNFTENTCFYDVGGYDGQSTLDFINNDSSYRKIYFFEPDKKILSAAQERLKEYSNIEFLPMAVGNETTNIGYNAIGGGAGEISVNGTEVVQMVSLDDFIDSRDSYIKIDVEGFEFSSLQGCERAIKKYKPMLSVSLYHRVGDIHKLINKVLSLNPNYRVYIRHYTESYADTRAYFIDG